MRRLQIMNARERYQIEKSRKHSRGSCEESHGLVALKDRQPIRLTFGPGKRDWKPLAEGQISIDRTVGCVARISGRGGNVGEI